MSLIECRNLVKNYHKVQALKGVDLMVDEGKIFGFLGPNGAGKTTLIKILTGLISPTSGTCRVNNIDASKTNPEHRMHIGYLSQKPAYYAWMTGEQLLHFTGSLFGLNRQECGRRTEELLRLSGLGKAGSRNISGYSGGMIQRLGIAQAIYHRPKVVFLDEPVSALDPIGRREVLQFIKQLKEETTVFMSTHILADVERVCDEVAIIKEGEIIIKEGTDVLIREHSTGYYLITFSDGRQAEDAAASLHSFINDIQVCESSVKIGEQEFIKNRSTILMTASENTWDLQGLHRETAGLEDVFMNIIETRSAV